MWATNDPDARFRFASDAHPRQATIARNIKAAVALAVVLLPVALALYFFLPANPVAAVAVGFLLGLGAAIPVGILLALVTEPKSAEPGTTVIIEREAETKELVVTR